jgi:hypothetical protein
MGNCHIKGYAPELRSRLENKFEDMGTVVPGARLHSITELFSQEMNLLTRKNTIILWGGSNDIVKNEAVRGLRSLRKFMNGKKNTNIIFITAPHRYDLM